MIIFMTIATPKTNPPARLLKTLAHVFRDTFTWHLLFINVLEDDSVFWNCGLFPTWLQLNFKWNSPGGRRTFSSDTILWSLCCIVSLILFFPLRIAKSERAKFTWRLSTQTGEICTVFNVHCISHPSSDNCKEFTCWVGGCQPRQVETGGETSIWSPRQLSTILDRYELRDKVHNPRPTI